jgi:hypothetical protein
MVYAIQILQGKKLFLAEGEKIQPVNLFHFGV